MGGGGGRAGSRIFTPYMYSHHVASLRVRVARLTILMHTDYEGPPPHLLVEGRVGA